MTRHALKFYRYAFARENYLLLVRVARAARLVRRQLRHRAGAADLTPQLKAALPVIPALYLPPQPQWQISEAEKIVRFASFAVAFPVRWGRCLQQSLIAWRLLNGYGIPAQLCIGVSRTDPDQGHVWVTRIADNQALAESSDPRERFRMIYASPLPDDQR
jgi:hypothetical protein